MGPSHKVNLLNWLSRGQSVASVGRHYEVNKSAICYIRKNKKAIRESGAASATPSTKVVSQVQDIHNEIMEKALSVWMEDKTEEHAFKWTSFAQT